MGWDNVGKSSQDFKEVEFLKFKVGTTLVRFLGDSGPVSRWKHWIPQLNRSLICPGKDCPVCKEIAEARKSGGKSNYNNSLRHHLLAIEKENEDDVGVLKIFEGSDTFFMDLRSLMEEIGPLNEFDIKVIRKGTGRDTSYTLIPVVTGNKDLSDEQVEMIADVGVDLEEYFSPPTVYQFQQLIDGVPSDEVFGGDNAES